MLIIHDVRIIDLLTREHGLPNLFLVQLVNLQTVTSLQKLSLFKALVVVCHTSFGEINNSISDYGGCR